MDENNTTETEPAFPDAIQDQTIEAPPRTEVRDTYDELIECELTEEDKATKRERLETVDRELVRLDTEKKAAAKVYTNQIKPLAAERESILEALNAGTERRQVECYEHFVKDSAGNILRVEVRRVDTDEVHEERAATEEEKEDAANEHRQPGLFDGGGSEPPPDYVSDPADEDTDEDDLEPTPEAMAQQAEDEQRLVRTTSKEAKARKSKRATAEQGAE